MTAEPRLRHQRGVREAYQRFRDHDPQPWKFPEEPDRAFIYAFLAGRDQERWESSWWRLRWLELQHDWQKFRRGWASQSSTTQASVIFASITSLGILYRLFTR